MEWPFYTPKTAVGKSVNLIEVLCLLYVVAGLFLSLAVIAL